MELRTITPVTGSPPSAPEVMFAAPCPISSRSRFDRGPVCILSTATAESRLSTLAISAMVMTATANAPQPASGNSGAKRMLSRSPGRSTRGRVIPAATDSTVTSAIAASGPGTLRTDAGSRGQTSRMPMVSTPITAAVSWWPTIWAGSSAMFLSAELWAVPPSTTWSWPRTIVTPIPASMPWTMAGEIASAARAMRLSPSRIWSAPAATVIAQVVAQPNVAMVSAMITVNPAAGPLTWRAEPPRAPATTPPTTAAINPATIGAPDASAIPSDSGTATRNTTNEAGRSCRSTARGFLMITIMITRKLVNCPICTT